MTPTRVDVVVVGAGIAGAVAACRLRELGAGPLVVADRPGATILHGGGWYLGISRLAERVPGAAARIGEALQFIDRGLPELELRDGPFTLTDTDGVPRTVDVAPGNHAAAAQMPVPMAVIDLRPLGRPFAEMQPAGTTLAVEYPTWSDAFGRSFAAVAGRLEQPIEQIRLRHALGRALRGTGVGSVLMPPVLGVRSATIIRRALQEQLGVAVAEALDTLPSTPGLRLHCALDSWLRRAEVPVRHARVTSIDVEVGRVETTEGPIDAGAIVLATGGVIPGGLEPIEDGLREPLAGIALSPRLPVDLLGAVHPNRPYGGVLFRAGVPVDRQMRPTGPDGEPLHSRLFAAGDVVGGLDRVADRVAGGYALFTGYLAGEEAAATC